MFFCLRSSKDTSELSQTSFPSAHLQKDSHQPVLIGGTMELSWGPSDRLSTEGRIERDREWEPPPSERRPLTVGGVATFCKTQEQRTMGEKEREWDKRREEKRREEKRREEKRREKIMDVRREGVSVETTTQIERERERERVSERESEKSCVCLWETKSNRVQREVHRDECVEWAVSNTKERRVWRRGKRVCPKYDNRTTQARKTNSQNVREDVFVSPLTLGPPKGVFWCVCVCVCVCECVDVCLCVCECGCRANACVFMRSFLLWLSYNR